MIVIKTKPSDHWLSPYKILKAVCFWENDSDVFYGHGKYKKWIELLTPISYWLMKFLDIVHPQIDYVKINDFDTWSVDFTLAPIILEMLKRLKANKQGSPTVNLEDVPEDLRATNTESYSDQSCFDFYQKESNFVYQPVHDRWSWVLDEMIFAFEHIVDDSWKEIFRSGIIDHKRVECAWDETGKATMYRLEKGPKHTYECDYDGMFKVENRIQNGLRLFGTYYQGLWS